MHKNPASEKDAKVTVRSDGQLYEGLRTARAYVWTPSTPTEIGTARPQTTLSGQMDTTTISREKAIAALLDRAHLKGEERRLFLQRFHRLNDASQKQLMDELKRRIDR